MDIGSKGLAEVNLTIPQSTSLSFTIVHKDEQGEVIDHSGSTAHMAIQSKDGETTYIMDPFCTCTSEYVMVAIPGSFTKELPLGKLVWDLIVSTQQGEQVRLCYGTVSVVNTYALDGE